MKGLRASHFRRIYKGLRLDLILTVAGFIIGKRCSIYYISSIGLLVSRGALVSSALVLTLLPALLLLCDRWIIRKNAARQRLLPGAPDLSAAFPDQNRGRCRCQQDTRQIKIRVFPFGNVLCYAFVTFYLL